MINPEQLRVQTKQRVKDALSLKVTDRLSAMVKMNVVLWNTQELLGAFRWAYEATAVADAFDGVNDLKEVLACLESSLVATHGAWDFVTAHLMRVAPETLGQIASHGQPDRRIHQ